MSLTFGDGLEKFNKIQATRHCLTIIYQCRSLFFFYFHDSRHAISSIIHSNSKNIIQYLVSIFIDCEIELPSSKIANNFSLNLIISNFSKDHSTNYDKYEVHAPFIDFLHPLYTETYVENNLKLIRKTVLS